MLEYNKESYIQHKVNNCKYYDRKKDYYDDFKTINKSWIKKTINQQFNRCYYCHIVMTYGEGITSKTDITIERIKNDEPHNRDNCVIACLKCNNWRGNNCKAEEFVVMVEALINFNK